MVERRRSGAGGWCERMVDAGRRLDWARQLAGWAIACAAVTAVATRGHASALRTGAEAQAAPKTRASAPPAVPGPPQLPDRTADFKLVATAYVDALRSVCYDSTVVAAMCMQLAPDNAPVTPEAKAKLQQSRRSRQKVREAVRDIRDGAAKEVLAFPTDSLVTASRAQAADLRLHVQADLRTLDEVQDLLGAVGVDKYVAYAKAMHLLKELDSGERGTRRKATLKAIMALKVE